MGFTHSWIQRRTFTEQEWGQIVTEARRVVAAAETAGIAVCGGLGDGTPTFTDAALYLNGSAALKQACETFRLCRERPTPSCPGELPGFQFCKTRQEPYDRVVTSILAAARRVAPEALVLGGDGGDAAFADTL